MAGRIKLHHILFLGFTLISAIPVIFLATWVQQSALNKEIAAVREKHLLLARNLTGGLSRYVSDVENAFKLASDNLGAGRKVEGLREMLQSMGINHVCIAEPDGLIRQVVLGLADSLGPRVPSPMLSALGGVMERARRAPGKIFFSDVMPNVRGEPSIFLIRYLPDQNYALGNLSTQYMVAVGKAITFGQRGHAAIVDSRGRVLAHPNPQWRRDMKDISAVKPVRSMLSGGTGVVKFFSPATKSDMIAGYTVVPRVGWGVMIPQPFEELEERAADVRLIALAIALLGIAFAAVLGWWLARYLARPIQAVVRSAREVAAGKLSSRAPVLPHFVPHELRELLSSFNRMVEEISAKVELEERLRESQKMEAVGQLAGGLAHDFNNLLNVIYGYTKLILADKELPQKTVTQLTHVQHAAERAAGLTRQLLAFSRREKLRPRYIDVNELITNQMQMVRRIIGETIELEVRPQASRAVVYGDAGALEQVLLNLSLNARDAMPRGGRLVIETLNVIADRGFYEQHSWAKQGQYVIISVRDTGAGMAAEVLEHVFEPFFTTKEVGKGSGLGLSMAYGIVQQHDGVIEAESVPGAGSTFRVYLPSFTKEPDIEPQTEGATVTGGGETILVAEDQEEVLTLLGDLLESMGYSVLKASNGAEALQVLASCGEDIDLAILDMVMPKMGGRELYEKIMEIKPSLPVLFSTGYAAETIDADFLAKSKIGLIEKPYAPDDLYRMLREVLERT